MYIFIILSLQILMIYSDCKYEEKLGNQGKLFGF